MNDLDIPIFKKTYELYKLLHEYRKSVPKQDRYTVFERCEIFVMAVTEGVIQAGTESKLNKVATLEHVSLKLNMLRVFIRLLKDVKTIDNKKYVTLENIVDEIGRMLGGWIKSCKTT
ncbi:MAG: hypothetical protein US58_C0012G0017 [Candidatus Magasanikbacteria bacterium GW2011_GWA2_37_8]|uniref:bAvd-like domain-containing protein n=1 Tax=Candidatus Magasanikbacteria bacterium GW2011_GWA2_37_8 TaxID=1619036 RepID=A0A0G0HC86_9BACT|nr:MAG: hypothetical protein US58_C0012G0017 [Candidatus Magasanikbacteria bacterium GW2011_GWA2_37_8]